MSSVVQRLENVAISDAQYQSQPPSEQAKSNEYTTTAASSAKPSLPISLPPPPPPQPPPEPTTFVPMAYNPAAPAAPETINHREKTPPPDEDPLNPLAVAVAHDYQKQPFTPAFLPQSQFPLGLTSPGLPPNGIRSPGLPPQFAAPPQQPGLQRAATMPTNASLASPGLSGSFGNCAIKGFSPHPPPPPPPASSSLIPSQAFQHASTHGGAQNYTHVQQSPIQPGGQDHSIHQQFYRPTETEFSDNKVPQSHHVKMETRGRLEENAGRLERGVSGMLRKFEKRFG